MPAAASVTDVAAFSLHIIRHRLMPSIRRPPLWSCRSESSFLVATASAASRSRCRSVCHGEFLGAMNLSCGRPACHVGFLHDRLPVLLLIFQ